MTNAPRGRYDRRPDIPLFLTAHPSLPLNELTSSPASAASRRNVWRITSSAAGHGREALAAAIVDVKTKIFRCSVCNNMTDVEPCAICTDARRDPTVLCVVEEAFNIQTIEQTRDFKGVYHVLLGALSPLKGIGPQDIDVGGLVKRVKGSDIREISRQNPTVKASHAPTSPNSYALSRRNTPSFGLGRRRSRYPTR